MSRYAKFSDGEIIDITDCGPTVKKGSVFICGAGHKEIVEVFTVEDTDLVPLSPKQHRAIHEGRN